MFDRLLRADVRIHVAALSLLCGLLYFPLLGRVGNRGIDLLASSQVGAAGLRVLRERPSLWARRK
jgi:hypothetical protein